MTIRVTCGSCQKTLNAKDEYAGRTVKCPQCAHPVKIRAAANSPGTRDGKAPPSTSSAARANTAATDTDLPARSSQSDAESLFPDDILPVAPVRKKAGATASTDPNQLMREILGGFQGTFARVRPTLMYRFAALFVAAFMVLLPMIYVGLVALLAYGLFVYATSGLSMFAGPGAIRNARAAFAAYVTPLFTGGVLLFFMIKPLFARPAGRLREVEVSFTDEPILHSFVQRLCEAVNAPFPGRIEVDCQVNAAAYFRKGWRGFLTNDLGLQIGLPLLAQLDMQQLAGVLAHELGHFSQGAGMRLSYVIRAVNHWFARVIYERDEWDEWLASTHEAENGWFVILGLLSSLFVGLTRLILWVLMVIGHIVCCVLLRQMEYDADKYEARLAGSDAFESTTRRMLELNLAQFATNQLIAQSAERAGLPDNLPLCLSKVARNLPPSIENQVEILIEQTATGWLDSHPADRDRIAAAKQQNAPGIFHVERPAKVLLKDFTKIAEAATLLYYKRLIGTRATKQHLTPTATFLAQVRNDAIDSAE